MAQPIPSTQADPPVPLGPLIPPEIPVPEEASPAKKPGKKPRAKRTTTLDSMVSRLMTLSPEYKGMSVAEVKKAVARGYDDDDSSNSIKLSLRSLIRARRNSSQSSVVVTKKATPESSEAQKKPKPAKSPKSTSTKKTTVKKGQGSEKTKGAKGREPGKIPANAPRAEKPKAGRPKLPQQKVTSGQVTSKK